MSRRARERLGPSGSRRLSMSRRARERLGLSGSVWERVSAWECLGAPVSAWERLGVPESARERMGVLVNAWLARVGLALAGLAGLGKEGANCHWSKRFLIVLLFWRPPKG